jgi:DNA-binding Lrp family transcriptional regulator
MATITVEEDGTRGCGMVSAYILVSVEPGKNQEVVAALRTVNGVKQAHACWGQPDIFAFVEVADEGALAETVLTTIQGIPGVRTTETHVTAPV